MSFIIVLVNEGNFLCESKCHCTMCKAGAFVSSEGCKYQGVHLYPKMKVLMVELNVFIRGHP